MSLTVTYIAPWWLASLKVNGPKMYDILCPLWKWKQYWGLSIYMYLSYSYSSTILLLQLIYSESSQFLLPDYSTDRFIAIIDGMDKRCRCTKIINEIISTEESYVRHLGLIVKVSWVWKVESDFYHEPRHFVGNETIFLKWAGN